MDRCRREKSAGRGGGRCPICRAPAAYGERPFCSRRCAELDLSRWLRGAYAIPVRPDDDEDGEDAAAAANGPQNGACLGQDDDAAGGA